jgi:hypothetical protein
MTAKDGGRAKLVRIPACMLGISDAEFVLEKLVGAGLPFSASVAPAVGAAGGLQPSATAGNRMSQMWAPGLVLP